MGSSHFKAKIGSLASQSSTPLYMQLRAVIRTAIEKGVLAQGECLPPERELATQYSVSRITLRKALEDLVREGLLERRQGAGTFVCSRVEKSFAKVTSFSEDMLARGWQPGSRWLERSAGIATPEEVMGLGISPNSKVFRLRRIRYAGSEPMALEQSVLPAFCLTTVDDVGNSLYEALERNGCRPVRALQRLRAIVADADCSLDLEIAEGAAVLVIERRGFAMDGRATELTRSIYRGDRYDFIAELKG